MFDDLRKKAIQNILENESLASDLDDEAADILIDWVTSLVDRIVSESPSGTSSSPDVSLEDRLGALRRMMRQISKWGTYVPNFTSDELKNRLERVLGFAAQVYGPSYTPPSPLRQRQFLMMPVPGPSAQLVTRMINLIQPQETSQPQVQKSDQPGETDAEENRKISFD